MTVPSHEWLDAEIARRALPCFPFSFERHIENRTAAETLSELGERFRALGLPVSQPQDSEGHIRHDCQPDYRKRVSNWEEFEAELASLDPDWLRWALEAV